MSWDSSTGSSRAAEKVPFPELDFENPKDVEAKVIRKVLPSWNIPTTKFKKFREGDYYPLDSVTFKDATPEKLLELFDILQKTWEYITPEEERAEHLSHSNKDMMSIFQDKRGKLERHKYQYDIRRGSVRHENHAIEGCVLCLCLTVRLVLTPKFLLRLLEKSRALLADDGDSAVETTSESDIQKTTEEPTGKKFDPFSSHEVASASLVRCIHLVLVDHFYYAPRKRYPSDPASDDELTATGNPGSASHWSQLYQYLRQDIEKNGPVPKQLESFFASVEFGSKLERITEYDVDKLATLKNDGRVMHVLAALAEARSVYEVEYELW